MIDLHIHSTFSDGQDTVQVILTKAQQKKLECISITDHNGVKAYNLLDTMDIKQYYTGEIICGIEMDSMYKGKNIEILAYGFEVGKVQNWVESTFKSRAARQSIFFQLLVKTCHEKGIRIDDYVSWDPNKEYAHMALYRSLVKYTENRAILGEEAWKSGGDFYRVVSVDATHPLAIDLSVVYPTLQEIDQVMHDAGAKIFLAHLYEYKLENKEEYLDSLVKENLLDGVEAYFSGNSDEQQEYLLKYCADHNLLVCGGSDCHNDPKKAIEIGTGWGNMAVPYDILNNWNIKRYL